MRDEEKLFIDVEEMNLDVVIFEVNLVCNGNGRHRCCWI